MLDFWRNENDFNQVADRANRTPIWRHQSYKMAQAIFEVLEGSNIF